METKTFEKKIADLKNELIAWLNDECPAVAPPLEPYDNSDLSHNFCELLRIRLDELSALRAEQGEKDCANCKFGDILRGKPCSECKHMEKWESNIPVEQSKLSAKQVFDKRYEVYRNLDCQPPIPLEARDMIFEAIEAYHSQFEGKELPEEELRKELVKFAGWLGENMSNSITDGTNEMIINNYLKNR